MKRRNRIDSSIKTVVAIGSLLMLTACHQEFSLLDANNTVVGKGSIETSAEYPAPVTAEVNGKKYSGTWQSTKVYEPNMAKMHRHLSTRSYDEYMRGDSSHQLKHGTANMSAEDGTQVECDFYYRSQPESGDCLMGDVSLTIRFSEGTH